VSRRRPSLEALRELVAAHLMRVPFENLSNLYRFHRYGLAEPPPPEVFLDEIEQYHFGGVCFTNNLYFDALLKALAYDARLCLADMRSPNAHMVIVVTIEGHDYLVDVGYGAPFSAPMPLDLVDDFVIDLPEAGYRLKPRDPLGRSRMEFYQGALLKGFYVVKPQPMCIEDLRQLIADAFLPEAPFRNFLLMARFWSNRFRVIHNFVVLDTGTNGLRAMRLSARADLVKCIKESFGMPSDIIAEAIDHLGALARGMHEPARGAALTGT
jgi:N-hydroxyarylamine O-acetyltransferase